MSAIHLRDALPESIATPRLSLRAPASNDLDQLVSLANNWAVIANTAVMPFPYTEADGRSFLAGTLTGATPRAYAITDTDNAFFGIVSLKCADGTVPELGYWLGQTLWGRGYAAEAVNALLDAARATGRFPRINARVLVDNPASVRVLEKSGFVLTETTTSMVERHLGKKLHVFAWFADGKDRAQ